MASSIYKCSDDNRDCNPCKVIHQRETEASFYCQECQEYLCPACRAHHKGVTLTTNHHVITLDPSVSTSSMQQSGRVIKGMEKISWDTRGNSLQLTSSHTNRKFSKATLTDQFDVAIDTERATCALRGILINDDLIFVVDRGNRTVKLFNKHAYVDQVHIPGAWALTRLSDGRVAVSDYNGKVLLLAVDGRAISIVGSITTIMTCFGICGYNDLIYVYCKQDDTTPQIHVYTLEGKLKRRIEPISQGEKLLSLPDYIIINPENGNIYVTDWNKGVIGLTSTGQVLFVNLPPYLKNAEGVDIDTYGQVYVCGLNSHNVKMSHDGQDSVEILSKDPECRYAQSVRVYGNKMYLCCRHTSVVKIYTLS